METNSGLEKNKSNHSGLQNINSGAKLLSVINWTEIAEPLSLTRVRGVVGETNVNFPECSIGLWNRGGLER